jgi:hypothetical protein
VRYLATTAGASAIAMASSVEIGKAESPQPDC